jgi:hypothetical protein
MSPNIHYTNWIDYYDALASSSVINQCKMELMFKSFNASISPINACLTMITNSNLVFLARTGNTKSLSLFHQLKVSGGTIVDPTEQSAVLLGLRGQSLIIVTPNIQTLYRDPHPNPYTVAARADIIKCTLVEEFNNLQDSNTQSIQSRKFIPVPPLPHSNPLRFD